MAGDAGWLPLHPPLCHSEYPSGHTADTTAMATVLRLLFG
jgi:hypothetical protein